MIRILFDATSTARRIADGALAAGTEVLPELVSARIAHARATHVFSSRFRLLL
jgi:hypothetical protein